MFKRSLFVILLLATTAATPSWADDQSSRIDRLEDQIRQLTGQIEVLTYQLKQLQAQKKLGALEAPATAPKPEAPVQQAANNETQGVEQIGDGPAPQQRRFQITGVMQGGTAQAAAAPGPTMLGAGSNRASQPGDGGYQGQLLVGPNGTATDATTDPQAKAAVATPASVQPAQADTPDDLYLRGYNAFMKLQYADAEGTFKQLLTKYPTHDVSGSAGYWLGESFWAEGNYTSAARAYQDSYKNFPKGRRAPDSLLKLGLSLARLGQKDQACTIIGSVDTEYPNAVDVKKKAQASFKREGCG